MGKATTEELTARLLEEGKGRTTGDWFETAAKIWTDRLDDPATGAALLHVLASLPDVTVEGATTDRAGRAAIAISTPVEKPGGWFPKQRQYLLVDPETGYLLATESVGLSSDEDAIGGPVDTPATIHYKVWLKSAFVTDTQTRP
ncbi:hypothetical protein SAMN05421504_106528 [Amycolatopsis xylanica]|uniref:Uncharacterized protein n=2 Tax=Amycolatopsis xylanica TaxID=589385 RepID=A0A1H3M8W8_9PSEU|nr:hypothetical protein SAMN05421504_106528 [Amycolatopsis xylanica]